MSKTTFSIIVTAVIALLALNARAAWLIDEKTFHISAHGQTACVDCHDQIDFPDAHPDPGNVNKRRTAFFEPDDCLMCHDEIEDGLDEGIHGSKTIQKREKYEYCIRCHKPHRQPRLGDNRIGEFDPSKPRREQCAACHEKQSALPELSAEDETCMSCHRLSGPEQPEGIQRIRKLCFHCHAPVDGEERIKARVAVPWIDGQNYDSSTHGNMACTNCHLDSAQYGHGKQTVRPCSACHPPHDEKPIHDQHRLVRCEACHFEGIQPVRDPESLMVSWSRPAEEEKPLRIHEMTIRDKERACRRCHVGGNQVGAAAMILPPKSILCMPCHTATFSIGDTTTMIALVVFLIGFLIVSTPWLTGTRPGKDNQGIVGKCLGILGDALKTLLSRKIIVIFKTLILDVVLQRRLFKQSDARWVIHSLIFLPFVFRFTWGMIALCLSLWVPEWALTQAMVDKNNPASAFLFDITGAMVLLGAAAAWIRGLRKKPEQPADLPGQDHLALGLMTGIILLGFILEGMRIAMTGRPDGSWNAFIGYTISGIFSDTADLTGVYGYVWYAHAVLTGGFVAYLPFSRMFHIIMAPIVLVMNAVSDHEGHERSE